MKPVLPKALSRPRLLRAENNDDTPIERVRVVVRLRPLSEEERCDGQVSLVRLPDKIDSRDTKRVIELTTKKNGGRKKNYRVDCAIGSVCSQQNMFETCGIERLLDQTLDGYATTVLAYGQTGSGKTYTMSGDEECIRSGKYMDPQCSGLIPRAMLYLFDRVANAPPHIQFEVTASFLEIYNKTPRDLLNRESVNLFVRWNEHDDFFIQNQLVVPCNSADDLMAVFIEGHRNRQVSSHELNRGSSRSHCILTVNISTTAFNASTGQSITKMGKVSFVDLAGSERLRKTHSSGERMLKEAGTINQSLFLLGKVISALGGIHSGKKPLTTHVSYRDSVLTKLLANSLGGNGLTLMIACCAPSSSHIKETMSTLNYATRARKIRNTPGLTIDADDAESSEINSQIQRLNMEVARLREMVSSARNIPAKPLTSNFSVPFTSMSVSPNSLSSSRASNISGSRVATIQAGPFDIRHQQPRRLPSLAERTTTSLHSHEINDFASAETSATAVKALHENSRIIGFNLLDNKIQSLLKQNSGLRDREWAIERQNYRVLCENNRLALKVENLEKVFTNNAVFNRASLDLHVSSWCSSDRNSASSLIPPNIDSNIHPYTFSHIKKHQLESLRYSSSPITQSKMSESSSSKEQQEIIALRKMNLKLLHEVEMNRKHRVNATTIPYGVLY